MAIEPGTGNLLSADVEALVNTVNTVGVMGKGIALQFKQAFPENFKAYERACKEGKVVPGRMFVFDRHSLVNPRFIVNFPTKRHWKGNARLSDVEAGLSDLVRVIDELGIRSIAVPPLGCGLGGLDWDDVRPRIVAALGAIPGLRVLLYAPAGAPPVDEMPVATKAPAMTEKVAALLYVFRRYGVPGYKLSRIEAQKLAYFLQAAGVPLKLEFRKYTYGPYADKLNHWLQHLEGHFIRGYGDGSAKSSMSVCEDAMPRIEAKLEENSEIEARAARVADLIYGFESPYGLELLATVHWVISEDGVAPNDTEGILHAVKAWNDRKARIFQDDHVRTAARRVASWLSDETRAGA